MARSKVLKDKLTVLLEGGIGNQLWQLAYAHYLQHEVFPNKVIQIRSRFSGNYKLLGIETFCTHLDYKLVCGNLSRKIHDRIFYKKISGLPRVRFLHYLDSESASNKPSRWAKYVSGHFQDVKFLESYDSPFVQEVIDWLDLEFSKGLLNDLPVLPTVHIRRGDYLDPIHMNQLGLLSGEYFRNVLKEVGFPKNRCVVLSDCVSINEIESNYGFRPKVFLGRQYSDVQSLGLISKSDTIITSNSTFSWWGAYIRSKRKNRPQPEIYIPFPFYRSIEKSREAISFPGVKFKDSKFEG